MALANFPGFKMGFWNNIKQADYSFEKLLFKGLAALFLCICCFYFLGESLDNVPHLKRFLSTNANGFIIFLVAGVTVFFINFTLYMGSLGPYEEETKSTIRAAKVGVMLSALFWIAWGIYCGQLFLAWKPMLSLVHYFIIGLATVPSFLMLIYTELLYRKILQEEATEKNESTNDGESDSYLLITERKMFAGYYTVLAIIKFCLVVSLGLIVGTSG